MKEQVFFATVAGLIHDIGKLMHRAEVASSRTWDREAQQQYKYWHALLSEDFAAQYLPDPWKKGVLPGVGAHHLPQNRLSCCVALADRLSAGERSDDITYLEESNTKSVRQLLSIFSDISLDNPSSVPQVYLPLRPLRLKEDHLYPSGSPASDTGRAYQDLWDGFQTHVKALKQAFSSGENPAWFVESLLSEIQTYLWCVPSAYYRQRADINLYDHSRMTAALSAILMDSSFSDEELYAFAHEPEKVSQPLALLVGGDLTGVQQFLYTITSRGAASGLRGRSFYLQLLVLVIARYVLNQLDLPITNLIYASGGNFFILARVEDAQRLSELQKEVTRILFNEHQGELGLILEGRTLKGEDFFDGRIKTEWDALIGQISRAKQRRLNVMNQEELTALFQPAGFGGESGTQCRVCGREHPKAKNVARDAETVEEIVKCPVCVSYEELGKDLRRARYLVFEPITPIPPKNSEAGQGWHDLLERFGMDVKVLENLSGKEKGEIFFLKDDDFEQRTPSDSRACLRYFLTNVTPLLSVKEYSSLKERNFPELPSPSSVKPLHVLEEQAKGVKRVGVLRMDVDNLGRLFAEGLGKYASLSRTASLSFAISLFFEGWVGVLAERMNEKDNERLYSIYSGGDDLFFVGSWDAVVELAITIRRELSKYTGGHPHIHPSGGIVLIGGKYPLYQAAEEAGEAEESAKKFRRQKADGTIQEKDAICFLDQTLDWQTFGLHDCNTNADTVHGMMHLLEKLANEENLRALIGKLAQLYQVYEEKQRELQKKGKAQNRQGQPQILWGPWIWRMEYTLARMEKQNEDSKDKIKAIRDQLKGKDGNYRRIEWIGLAARWAELITRNSK
ncbi:type III-A CRISPR-associated protein Cas10/Csm1 [Anaerolinea thermophila]|uniref:CRISPR system single-strand-specific deoxyribonuclease Cas10/Csm1 (subtype III-A) n=1 Tax=Anaerolinea thermophila (strain DSM 14523 / JCM 11388 / NBRC 100420 / UNI-1) TaxID=926569 RepID=E8MZC7_ANATU|nr:type III-A CRISPR-associated protein Cas10/Csm1 [Anaerolinea thermophila]BAJ64475.1 hypothetical protein ANT_24490 [Anaerolinea thermophila UNI-1]